LFELKMDRRRLEGDEEMKMSEAEGEVDSAGVSAKRSSTKKSRLVSTGNRQPSI
jgi:hypothetical protein